MTNENELKVVDIIAGLNITADSRSRGRYLSGDDCENLSDAINLIKSQQSRIELCESAIREFLSNQEDYFKYDDSLISALDKLSNLMEQAK